MKRIFAGCLLTLVCGGAIGAVLTLGGYAYYQAYPSMHGWLFATLGVLLLGILLSLPRMLCPRPDNPDDLPRCRECGQPSPSLKWSAYSCDGQIHHTWLCQDCQNYYHDFHPDTTA
jgi:hypothetical protein